MQRIKKVLLGLAIGLTAQLAAAFPDKPVKMIIPYPAGGPTDSVARIIAEKLGASWGQPVIVDNRPGAAGSIGTELAVKAPADGYTLLLHSPIMLSTELTRPSVKYRTLRDFQAVSTLFTSAVFLMASNEATQGDLKQVLASARNGDLTYGTHGLGTTGHYMGERLQKVSGVSMTHAPFSGDATIMTALMGGHIKAGILSGTGARKALDSGKVRGLAVASPARSPLLPEIPTFTEKGFPGFDRESWVVIFAPAGTPTAIGERIARDVDSIVKQPSVKKQLHDLGLTPKGGTPAESQAMVKDDYGYWAKLIEEFGTLSK